MDGKYDTAGWNWFAYVKNNPIVYKYPTRHLVDGSTFGVDEESIKNRNYDEFWFQINIHEVENILNNKIKVIQIRKAE